MLTTRSLVKEMTQALPADFCDDVTESSHPPPPQSPPAQAPTHLPIRTLLQETKQGNYHIRSLEFEWLRPHPLAPPPWSRPLSLFTSSIEIDLVVIDGVVAVAPTQVRTTSSRTTA